MIAFASASPSWIGSLCAILCAAVEARVRQALPPDCPTPNRPDRVAGLLRCNHAGGAVICCVVRVTPLCKLPLRPPAAKWCRTCDWLLPPRGYCWEVEKIARQRVRNIGYIDSDGDSMKRGPICSTTATGFAAIFGGVGCGYVVSDRDAIGFIRFRLRCGKIKRPAICRGNGQCPALIHRKYA
jgi:hypothetical protein